ncbi:TetR family transcriptional regulator [Microtetraspora sp. NBRC 13810]|uniref:TetR/AcrR family transcriptional regulator n=1 Tax=Microtetraspora sp. NBRC 13810 TaxID=3030990 RepID=UPI0024A39B0F|nr:TetR/AcrR family transcriptional regulator [Microtetraspora sp. NBRC 13810]GLW09511.1 TetR family transcriptional regulator [Microtetraspora sp. NBRC 13810]
MDLRTRILEAAADLLSRSTEADFSTRAVCEAAGIGAPQLYRQFGDKEGLLSAVVDYGFERYLAGKRAARPSADPVRDLRDGWDNHVAFAVEHPNYYRLMYSPGLSTPPEAAAEAHRLLLGVLERCAAAGRLRVSPQVAAQMVMSANTGVALSLITRPAIYPDPGFSAQVREAVFAAVTVPGDEPPATGRTTGVAAATLGALLRETPPAVLSAAETALLHQWLTALADAPE